MLVILELLCRCFINLVQRSSSEFTALRTRTGPSLNQNRWSGPEFGQRGRTKLKVQFRVQKIYLVNRTEPDFDTTTLDLAAVPDSVITKANFEPNWPLPFRVLRFHHWTDYLLCWKKWWKNSKNEVQRNYSIVMVVYTGLLLPNTNTL